MLLFAAAVFGLIITPGPGVLSTAGVGSAYGFRPGITFLVGMFVGCNVVFLSVVSGVAAMVLAEPALRTVLFWASTAYLLYLALKIALSGSRIAFISPENPPGFIGGAVLQLLNPKAYVVAGTLFGGFNFAPDHLAFEVTAKMIILNLIWIPIHLLWLQAGVQLRRLDLPPRTQRIINAGMAVAMLAVVGIAAASQA